jgi:hypothetical protein
MAPCGLELEKASPAGAHYSVFREAQVGAAPEEACRA